MQYVSTGIIQQLSEKRYLLDYINFDICSQRPIAERNYKPEDWNIASWELLFDSCFRKLVNIDILKANYWRHHYMRINDVIIICGLLTSLYADIIICGLLTTSIGGLLTYGHHYMRTTSQLHADYWYMRTIDVIIICGLLTSSLLQSQRFGRRAPTAFVRYMSTRATYREFGTERVVY